MAWHGHETAGHDHGHDHEHDGMAWYGMTWHDMERTWHDMTQTMTMTRHDMA